MNINHVFNHYSKFYDDIYKMKDYFKEAVYVNNLIKKYTIKKINRMLSLGCGTCSHDILLAKMGYKITGVDQSDAMLKIAEKKIKRANLEDKITLIKSDIRSMIINKEHDLALALFNVIGYQISNSDIKKVLENVYFSIKSGGFFLLDCWYLPAVLKDKPTDRVREINIGVNRLIRITKSKLLIDRNIIEIKFHILSINNNVIIDENEETHFMRYWSLPELNYILKSSGFDIIKTGNFLDIETPVSENNWDIFVIARKS